MKRAAFLIALVAGPLLAAAHGYFPPKFGGIMSEGGEISVELVAHEGRTVLYVEDHGTPILTEGASGAMGIASPGKEQRVVALAADGGNRLVGPPSGLQPGDRVVATAQFPDGNVMFVRFRVRAPEEPPAAAPQPFAPPFAKPFSLPIPIPAPRAEPLSPGDSP